MASLASVIAFFVWRMNATLTIDIFKHYFDIDVVCPVVRGKLFCPRCSEIGGGRCDEVAEVLLDDLFTIDDDAATI